MTVKNNSCKLRAMNGRVVQLSLTVGSRHISSTPLPRTIAYKLNRRRLPSRPHNQPTYARASAMDLEDRESARVDPPEELISAVSQKKNGFAVFWDKCKRAWAIFFPPEEHPGSQRLKMVLLAERASLPPENLDAMKLSIVDAMREYVEVDDGEEVTVTFSTDPISGIVYCVAVPVKAAVKDLEPREVTPEEHGEFVEEYDTEFWERTAEARYPWGF